MAGGLVEVPNGPSAVYGSRNPQWEPNAVNMRSVEATADVGDGAG